MRPGVEAVEAYLAQVPEPARTTLQKMRALIRAAAPKDAEETISYAVPAFRYKGGLVAYGAFEDHCSFFPMTGSLPPEFDKDLAKYERSKGTIRFPVDKPLPAALVKRIVKARVLQNEARKKA